MNNQYHVSVYFLDDVVLVCMGKMSLYPSTLLWMLDYEVVKQTDHSLYTSKATYIWFIIDAN